MQKHRGSVPLASAASLIVIDDQGHADMLSAADIRKYFASPVLDRHRLLVGNLEY